MNVSIPQTPGHTSGNHTHNTQTHCHPLEGLVYQSHPIQKKKKRRISEDPGISLPDKQRDPVLHPLAEASILLPASVT